MHIILVVSELVYNLSIIAMAYAAYTNVVDYHIAFIFALLIIGIIFSISPYMLREVNLLKSTGKYSDYDIILKFIMWVQTLYLAHNFFIVTMIINIICMAVTILCKAKMCNEIKTLNISVSDAISSIKRIDSSYIDPHNPFIIGNFLMIMIFTSFHKNITEMIISGVICMVYFGIGIYRIWRNDYISKRDIFLLSVINLVMIILNSFGFRLITCILWAEFYSKMRDAEGLLLLSWFCDDFFDEEAEGLPLFS